MSVELEQWSVVSEAPAETETLGRLLGALLQGGDVVALSGELGAGKTALTQGIARGLGVTQPVTSPTFTLVNEYAIPNRGRLYHLDTYRLGDATLLAEADGLGLAEILDDPDGVVVIEWAERIAQILPPDHLQIQLAHCQDAPDSRRLHCAAYGPRSSHLVVQLRMQILALRSPTA